MSHEGIQEVTGTALIDAAFRKELLSGRGLRLLARFDLTPREREMINKARRLKTIEKFATHCDEWIDKHPEVKKKKRF